MAAYYRDSGINLGRRNAIDLGEPQFGFGNDAPDCITLSLGLCQWILVLLFLLSLSALAVILAFIFYLCG